MTFDDAFERVIGHEGGYVNDPQDPGGETKFGISKRAFPTEDIAGLTLQKAKNLYWQHYWSAAGCEAVPEGLRFDLFDMAVNQGVKPAIRALQAAVSETTDGVIGPRTLQALQSTPAWRVAIRFNAERLLRYTETANWDRFGRGWTKRVAENMKGL